jgi:hypothetical protein
MGGLRTQRGERHMSNEKERSMTKSWNATLVALAALAAVTAPAGAEAAVCGDLNGSGTVDVADALILSNVLAGNPAPGNVCGGMGLTQCADVFKDGSISGPDLASLVDTVAGLETLFDPCSGPGSAISCGGGSVTLPSQTITTSQVWPKSCAVTIGGTIIVDTPQGAPTTVLTIERGATIKGLVGSEDPAALIIFPGSKINAQGTAAEPIIFTSSAAPGNRTSGDWGGVMINGRGTVNRPNCQNVAEGLEEPYGGCDPHDSSGIVTYLRSEFSGKLFTPNNELNSFTLNGVGDGTVLHHIQGHAGADDCIEWFGGTSRMKYAVASACGDDGFDWQLGFTGALQFGLQIQAASTFSAATGDCRGIEADNSEFGQNDLPRSNPSMCNLTMVGDKTGSPLADVGILFRRGTAGTVANSIITNYQDAGVEFRDVSTSEQACTDATHLKTAAPNLRVRNSIFFSNGDSTSEVPNAEHCKHLSTPIAGALCQPCDWYDLLVKSEKVLNENGDNTVDPGQSTTYPATGQLYAAKPTGAQPSQVASCAAINEFFENTTYAGAFDPAGPDTGWLTQPWLNFDLN